MDDEVPRSPDAKHPDDDRPRRGGIIIGVVLFVSVLVLITAYGQCARMAG